MGCEFFFCFSKYRLFLFILQPLLCRAYDTCGRSIGFKTSSPSAAAGPSVPYGYYVTEFTCESIMSIYQLSVGNEATPHSRAESHHDEVLHALCRSVDHFSKCCGICIIRRSNIESYCLTY